MCGRWDEEDAENLLCQPSFQATAQLAVRLHSYLGVSDHNIIANRSYVATPAAACDDLPPVMGFL